MYLDSKYQSFMLSLEKLHHTKASCMCVVVVLIKPEPEQEM